MGVVIGESAHTQFSYIEYQALMLVLAGMICMGFLAIEVFLNRFQVLPLLFPGMFSIRERRFYFFDFEVDDVAIGQKLRAEAKMLARITLCVVFSYLWQHCVLETEQIVGTDFPSEQCSQHKDCFASELHFLTLVNRQHTALQCDGPQEEFQNRVVVSCIRFIKPTATTWLMHLAISHSVTQLNLKCYEMFSWTAGNYRLARRIIVFLTFVSLCLCLSLFFSGVMSEFVSSWLSFVMSMSIPIFLITVHKTSKIFETLHRLASTRAQERIEQHLNAALADFDVTKSDRDEAEGDDEEAQISTSRVGFRKSLQKGARLLTRFVPTRQRSEERSQSGVSQERSQSGDNLSASTAPQPPQPSSSVSPDTDLPRGSDSSQEVPSAV